MAKNFKQKQKNEEEVRPEHGHFLYPTGELRWGINVRVHGQCGIALNEEEKNRAKESEESKKELIEELFKKTENSENQ